MRKKIVAGNWKMNENLQEGVALAKEINETLKADKPNCGVIICTPFIHLASVAQVIDQNVVALGAENCADKEKGAYTGEVSAAMVKSTGAQYVILGHSERRQYYHETAEILKSSTAASSISLLRSGRTSSWLTSRSGLSVPARPLRLTRLRRCWLTSALSLPRSMAKRLLRTPQSSTVAAASPAMLLSSSLSPTSTVALSAALL